MVSSLPSYSKAVATLSVEYCQENLKGLEIEVWVWASALCHSWVFHLKLCYTGTQSKQIERLLLKNDRFWSHSASKGSKEGHKAWLNGAIVLSPIPNELLRLPSSFHTGATEGRVRFHISPFLKIIELRGIFSSPGQYKKIPKTTIQLHYLMSCWQFLYIYHIYHLAHELVR